MSEQAPARSPGTGAGPAAAEGRPRPGAARLRFAGLGYALAVLIAGTNLPTPLYAVYERVFGITALDVTALVAVYAAAVTAALLLLGPLSDAVGYRPVLVAGLLTAAAGAALLAGARGLGWLVAGRAVQGLAVGASSGALSAGLVLTEPRGRRARASLAASAVITAGVGAGPVLAGALAQYGPAPLALPYLVEIVLLAPALAAVAWLPAGLGAAGQAWRPRRPRLPAARRDFAGAAAAGFLAWAVAYVVLALVPSYAAGLGGGGLLAGGAAAGSLLLVAAAAQVALRSWPPGRSQRTGLALLIAGLAGLAGAGPLGGGPPLFAAIALAGAGQGLAFAGAVRRVNDIAPDGERAGAISLLYVVTYLGGGGAALGVGALAEALPLTAAVQVFAAVCAVSAAALLLALRRRGGPL